MSVRAKFYCNMIDHTNKTVYLSPVYSGSDENKQFFAATPGGQISLYTVNPDALAQFQMGTEYYIDFTACDRVLHRLHRLHAGISAKGESNG